MSTYTIVKSYKLYEGGTDSGQPIDDLGGAQLLGWLKDKGYSYEKAEQLMKNLNDRGSIRLQTPGESTYA